MSFKDVRFMTPLPANTLTKNEEGTMKEWLEKYRPVRQKTVRQPKIRQEFFSPAMDAKTNPKAVRRVHFPPDQVKMVTPTASSENCSVVDEECGISFISDVTVPQLASEADFNQVEEYESESDHSDTDSADFDLIYRRWLSVNL